MTVLICFLVIGNLYIFAMLSGIFKSLEKKPPKENDMSDDRAAMFMIGIFSALIFNAIFLTTLICKLVEA